MSAVGILTYALLSLSVVTGLVITERPEQMKDLLPLSEDLYQSNFAESHTSMQLAKDILLRLSANDGARQKHFNNAKLEPSSFSELLRSVQEEIQPLKGSMVSLLQRSSMDPVITGIATGLPTPAFSYNFETGAEGFNVEIRIRPNINVGLWSPGYGFGFLKKPKGVDWDVETKYRLGFLFQNYGDKTKLMWTAYDCAEWVKMGPGMFWSWTSDVSDSNIRKEKGMAIFGVPTYKFQLYIEIRFVIASRVGLRGKGFGFKIVTAFDRGRNYHTLGYQDKEPSSFWAQWTVFEYENSKDPSRKTQFAPVFVGDGDFTKMLGWGMELLVFTSFRKAGREGPRWYRNIERCNQQVTSLLGKVIQNICKRMGLPKTHPFYNEKKFNEQNELEVMPTACPDKGTWNPINLVYGDTKPPGSFTSKDDNPNYMSCTELWDYEQTFNKDYKPQRTAIQEAENYDKLQGEDENAALMNRVIAARIPGPPPGPPPDDLDPPPPPPPPPPAATSRWADAKRKWWAVNGMSNVYPEEELYEPPMAGAQTTDYTSA